MTGGWFMTLLYQHYHCFDSDVYWVTDTETRTSSDPLFGFRNGIRFPHKLSTLVPDSISWAHWKSSKSGHPRVFLPKSCLIDQIESLAICGNLVLTTFKRLKTISNPTADYQRPTQGPQLAPVVLLHHQLRQAQRPLCWERPLLALMKKLQGDSGLKVASSEILLFNMFHV